MNKIIKWVGFFIFPLSCIASNTAEITIDSELEVKPWFTVQVNDRNINFTSQVKAVTQNCSVANEAGYVYAGKSSNISFLSNIPNPNYRIRCDQATMNHHGSSHTITLESYICIETQAKPLGSKISPVLKKGAEVLLLVKKEDGGNTSYLKRGVYKGQFVCHVSVDY
ncbi:hypothetical protein [Cysteiniphilum halobium]|uniref:hypothetical protein n=1 Tax=Cysteiniphilum halobium TaxID=2219059 RepID=UPI000E658800|nr:hypothetical protein [Cysteiniphilum halobium]